MTRRSKGTRWIMALLPLAVMASGRAAIAAPLDRIGVGYDATIPIGKQVSRSFAVEIEGGGSAEIVVTQQGVDVVVDVIAPDGTPMASIDTPNGRNGDEVVEIAASQSGVHRIVVRPIADSEPSGTFRMRVLAIRDAAATARLLEQRRLAREEATRWLRSRSTRFSGGRIAGVLRSEAFQAFVRDARIVGLGEATHGSREFADARLVITKDMVQRAGFRLIALEGSSSRIRALEPWLRGGARGSLPPEPGVWIGVRARDELLEWVRAWNVAHGSDRVSVVGIDANDNVVARIAFGEFIGEAYGLAAARAWEVIDREFAAADAKAPFGDSSFKEETRSALLAELGRIEMDQAMLRVRFGAARVQAAVDAGRDLAQFADFNTPGTALTHSRDWYMAANLVDAMERRGSRTRAVLWAHNAHVVGGRPGSNVTGGFLRTAFDCGYRSVAMTFGSGDTLAQVAPDPSAGVAVATLPAAEPESIDGVLANVQPGGAFVSWPCRVSSGVPPWLAADRLMHWIGGIWSPAADAKLASKPYTLTRDFDAVLFFPTVTAEAPRRTAP